MACWCRAATSVGDIACTASHTFHPLGRSSNARRSALLLRLDSVPFRVEMLLLRTSIRFLGRPRSMMPPDSDWPLLCPYMTAFALRGSSVFGVGASSIVVWLGVVAVRPSHGLGDDRFSTMGGGLGVSRVGGVGGGGVDWG